MSGAASTELDDPILRNVLGYWRRQCGDRRMPAPGDIDPIGLGPRVLPHLVLVDVEQQGGLRYRLCGTGIIAEVGRDLKGERVDGFHPDQAYGEWLLSLYRRSIASCRPLYSESTYLSPEAGLARRTFRLLCPLSPDDRTVTRLLGAQTFTFDPPQALRHLGEPERYQTGPIREL
jgi:hypothetical protein